MTFKQIWNAGHGYNTPGKRSPDGMREYEFNRAVAAYCKEITDVEYIGVQSIHTHSDSRDVPLQERTDYANKIKADCYTSIHANAAGNGWNDASGIETFVYKTRPEKAYALALQVQRDLIPSTGLKDRGVKIADFHELRETNMTSILVEAGFMTNKSDCEQLKSVEYRKKVARALVKAHAAFFGWEKKPVFKATSAKKEEDIMSEPFKPTVGAINNSVSTVLKRFERKDPALAERWRKEFLNGEMTLSDAIGILYVAVDRGYIVGKSE